MSDSLLQILEVLNEVLSEREMPTSKAIQDLEPTQPKQMSFTIPSFKISEKWGKPDAEDRKTIEMFTSRITGQSFAEKINTINSFVTDCEEKCIQTKDVSEILASLIVLEAFVAIINDYNPQTGGFLFESLVAALIGAGTEQVSTRGGRDQDVVDVRLSDGTPMGLKLYGDYPSYLRVSYKNAVRDYQKYGSKPIRQIIGIKSKDTKTGELVSFNFYEFTIGTEEDVERGLADYAIEDMSISPSEEGGKRTTAGIPSREITNQEFYTATLDFGASRTQLQQIAQMYSEKLGQTMNDIYSNLELLSANVSRYYAGDTAAGRVAQKNADDLKNATDELD